MAKVFGIQGNVKGKIANTIYAVVKGVNIARAYNAEPANPQTSAQIESRAKLKMLSQTAKALAPIIAFRPMGLVSSRNLFVKANYEHASYSEGVASIQDSDIDLTGGVIALGTLDASKAEGSVQASVENAGANIGVVVFGIVGVKGSGAIHVYPVQNVVATTEGQTTFTSAAVPVDDDERLEIYAFGIRYNDSNELAKYQSILTSQAGVTSLQVLSRLQPGSSSITETLHYEIPSA